jgi:CBS domain-containing protein
MVEERIEAVMQTDIVRLSPDMPIREAVARLVETESAAAPVVDETDTLVGILSQKDCFRSALNASYYQQWSGTVAEHFTPDVETLDASTDFVTAAEMFLEKPYRTYPVVRGGQLVGILARSDLLAAFLKYG